MHNVLEIDLGQVCLKSKVMQAVELCIYVFQLTFKLNEWQTD